MEDGFGRRIDYLRLSVTDRCNLRCRYCLPAAGVPAKPREEILSFEEVLRLVRVALTLGIRRVRLTGGEPLVRKGIVSFVARLARLPGLEDLALTTNGTLLAPLGRELREAGLQRLNISLDTLDPVKYRWLTRGGELGAVLEGIEAALALGFAPVKINVVVLRGVNDTEWEDLAALSIERPLHVRFIELMPVGASWSLAGEHFAPCAAVRARLEERFGRLIPAEGVAGAGPARYFRLPGALGTVGFITGVSDHFCATCNRVRLTADGKLRLCLHAQEEFDLRALLRAGASDAELAAAWRAALLCKPRASPGAGSAAGGRGMCQIGG